MGGSNVFLCLNLTIRKVENVNDVEKNAVRIDFAGAMMSMKEYAEHTDFLDYVGMKLIKLADAAIDKSREQSHIYYADWTEHEIIILASLMKETTKKGGFRKNGRVPRHSI